jgi:hypothetical protein
MSILSDLNNKSSSPDFTYSVIDELNMSIIDELPEIFIRATPSIQNGPIPCFMRGTKILTDEGEKLIEDLKKGMFLISNKNEKIKLLDIHCFTTYKNKDTHPCLIKKDYIINGIKCNSDLYISQYHSLLIDNYFVPVKNLIKPKKIQDNSDHYSYYHLITENFFTDTVISNGIPTETYGTNMIKNMNKEFYKYLNKNIKKKGYRTLLEKSEFIKLTNNFSKIQEMKKRTIFQNSTD